ncbi:DUF84 family protein [Gracilibacillus halotolerans]
MVIIVGSLNKAKIEAVKTVFPEDDIQALDIDSRVSSQPKSDDETRQGAINRAIACQTESTYGIGLEGGVYQQGDSWYLCSWGALKTPADNIFVAGGARIPLPSTISDEIINGKELGVMMEELMNKETIRQHEGTVGVLSNNLVNRKSMFVEIVKLLRGQMEFQQSMKQL